MSRIQTAGPKDSFTPNAVRCGAASCCVLSFLPHTARRRNATHPVWTNLKWATPNDKDHHLCLKWLTIIIVRKLTHACIQSKTSLSVDHVLCCYVSTYRARPRFRNVQTVIDLGAAPHSVKQFLLDFFQHNCQSLHCNPKPRSDVNTQQQQILPRISKQQPACCQSNYPRTAGDVSMYLAQHFGTFCRIISDITLSPDVFRHYLKSYLFARYCSVR